MVEEYFAQVSTKSQNYVLEVGNTVFYVLSLIYKNKPKSLGEGSINDAIVSMIQSILMIRHLGMASIVALIMMEKAFFLKKALHI